MRARAYALAISRAAALRPGAKSSSDSCPPPSSAFRIGCCIDASVAPGRFSPSVHQTSDSASRGGQSRAETGTLEAFADDLLAGQQLRADSGKVAILDIYDQPGTTVTNESPVRVAPSIDAYDASSKALATIDGEGDTDLQAVRQRSGALDAVQKKCPSERRSRLADYAAFTKQEAEKEGVEISTLQALRGVNKSIAPRLAGKVTCTEIFAAYTLLVTSGSKP